MLVAMLAVLVLAEGAARGLSPYLPEPRLYADDATQVKAAQLDRLAGSCVDLVVAGDSMGRDAFDPAVFASADPSRRSSYNASLDGASPSLLRRWITEEVVPRLRPSTVVITLASLDLNANANAATSALAAYNDARLTADGPGGRISSWFVRHLAVVRHRAELRDPAAVAEGMSAWRDGIAQPRSSSDGIKGLIGPTGEGLSRRSLRYRHDSATKAFTRDQLLAKFTIDDEQLRDTEAMLRELRDAGVDVAVVVLPVTQDYIALHPGAQADFDAFLEGTRSVAASAGVPFIDLHGTQTDETLFADTHHLNGDGQAWFSSTLPDQLEAAGVPVVQRCG